VIKLLSEVKLLSPHEWTLFLISILLEGQLTTTWTDPSCFLFVEITLFYMLPISTFHLSWAFLLWVKIAIYQVYHNAHPLIVPHVIIKKTLTKTKMDGCS